MTIAWIVMKMFNPVENDAKVNPNRMVIFRHFGAVESSPDLNQRNQLHAT